MFLSEPHGILGGHCSMLWQSALTLTKKTIKKTKLYIFIHIWLECLCSWSQLISEFHFMWNSTISYDICFLCRIFNSRLEGKALKPRVSASHIGFIMGQTENYLTREQVIWKQKRMIYSCMH